MIIGLVGYKGSGKTTLANYMLGKNPIDKAASPGVPLYSRVGFSDPMYSIANVLGVPWHVIEDKKKWDVPLEELCGKSLRYAMQTIGTEWGRKLIGEDLWCRAAVKRAFNKEASGYVVIMDNVRFANEQMEIWAVGGVCIAVHRPEVKPDVIEHESEQYIEQLQARCDYEFHNGGDTLDTAPVAFATLIDAIIRGVPRDTP